MSRGVLEIRYVQDYGFTLFEDNLVLFSVVIQGMSDDMIAHSMGLLSVFLLGKFVSGEGTSSSELRP